MYADLHLHSAASDGTNSPEEVVKKAKEMGFAGIALTDHDTVDGLEEALNAGRKLGIEVIPGIEISTLQGEEELHVLGYFINWRDETLIKKLKLFVESRKTRAEKMVRKLNELGIKISLERVKQIAGPDFIGRPHIAKALIEKGYVKSIPEAFTERFIGKNGKAYVERYKVNVEEGIKMILDAGGIPVLAHPGLIHRDYGRVSEETIIKYKGMGLKGIEVFYSKHDENTTKRFFDIAQRNGLLITGGSDCHGDNGEGRLMGTVKLPYMYVEKLKRAKARLVSADYRNEIIK